MSDAVTKAKEVLEHENIWDRTVSFFSEKYLDVIVFVITLVLGIIITKLMVRALNRIMTKKKLDGITVTFTTGIVRFVLYLLLALTLLSQIGVNITGIITALSAAVLAIGMALNDNFANFASGLIIVGTKLYHKGDYIEIDGKEGCVDSINFLFTILYTYEKKKIIIPNSKITSESVINVFSAPTRRVNFTFSVAYDSDVDLVKKTTIEAMLSDKRVKRTPKPFCALNSFGSSSIDFFSYCWCDSADYWKVLYSVNERVFNEFKRNGICIPYNQLEVRMRTDDVKMPVIEKMSDKSNNDYPNIGS